MADIIKIDEKTYRIEDGMVRFFILIGEKKALLIDSGMNTQDGNIYMLGNPIKLYKFPYAGFYGERLQSHHT